MGKQYFLKQLSRFILTELCGKEMVLNLYLCFVIFPLAVYDVRSEIIFFWILISHMFILREENFTLQGLFLGCSTLFFYARLTLGSKIPGIAHMCV